ncbi:adenosylcobinamide-phosphate synthase CbiB [Desulfomarina sp.]
MIYSFQILAAIALDLFFGDPRWFPHPVRLIGRLCTVMEKLTRRLFTNEIPAGFITVLIVLAVTGGTTLILLLSANSLGGPVTTCVAVILLYFSFAVKDLVRHSEEVFRELTDKNDLEGARKAIARIVGRDTDSLDQEEISRACVETVAENMVDGMTAPFFYAVVFSIFSGCLALPAIGWSAVGAMLYKAVNTMDSMIGYKNKKYERFGRIAAKLDDICNFLPARISGVILILAAFILKLDYRGALRIFSRDRLAHASPNAGHTEAVVAGAFGFFLGGTSTYFGAPVEKPVIGDKLRDIEPGDIKKCNTFIIVGYFLFVVLLLVLRMLWIFLK